MFPDFSYIFLVLFGTPSYFFYFFTPSYFCFCYFCLGLRLTFFNRLSFAFDVTFDVTPSYFCFMGEGMVKLIQLPVLTDNYAYIVLCEETGAAALIDTPDAQVILEHLEKAGIKPSAILNTHHHFDHAGGNQQILQRHTIPVYCGEKDAPLVSGVTHLVRNGDEVQVGALTFKVLDVPGHTRGHVAYFGHGFLFCGDTLFVGGCGRLFEGTPQDMYASLKKLTSLPPDTKVCCAHEYTLNNLNFAMTLEPHNSDLQSQLKRVERLRKNNRPTVPSILGDELLYNPFLRSSPEIVESLRRKGYSDLQGPVKVFSVIRELKDGY